MLTRHGVLVPDAGPDLKKDLTVRPIVNALGIGSASFRVFRKVPGGLIVPRYYSSTGPTRDVRLPCAPAPGINFVGKLRDPTRQPEAFDAGTAAFTEKGGGVLSLPCGFGKTTIGLALAAHLKLRTMIVVHKEFLANQWIDKIREFCPGATIGRVQGDLFDIEKDFVVAMIQTMSQREFAETAFDSIGFLIVDEAHHIGAPAFSQFMFKICPKHTLGLTATPERKDGLTRLLYWFLGPEFFRIERTDQKSTSVVTVPYSSSLFKESPPLTRFGQLNMAGMINILVEIEERNELIIRETHRALKNKRRVLILSDRRDHCLNLHSKLKDLAGLYIGGMKEDDLARSAECPVVVATFQLAHEGLDIPALDTVILATPKSDIKQSIGRIMRETPGKSNDPLIIDIADQWSVFHAMYRKRLKVYQEGGFVLPGTAAPVPTSKCLFD